MQGPTGHITPLLYIRGIGSDRATRAERHTAGADGRTDDGRPATSRDELRTTRPAPDGNRTAITHTSDTILGRRCCNRELLDFFNIKAYCIRYDK